MSKLKGKVCLVTGAAQGLGKAFCQALLTKGAKVCIVDVNQETGEATVKAFKEAYGKENAAFIKCDVTSQADMENAFAFTKKTLGGPVEILCNNAGVSDERLWDQLIQVNLISVIRGTMLGITNMSLENGGEGGTIVNIASIAALMTSHSAPAYCAAKHGVLAFTRSWAKNPACKKMGLRFHALCPSFAKTEIVRLEEGHVIDPENARRHMDDYGMMSPETVAEAFLQLLDRDDSSGEVLFVAEKQGQRWLQEAPRPM